MRTLDNAGQMPISEFSAYCDWINALDAAIGARDFHGGIYEMCDDLDGDYYCRGCDALLSSPDARCPACEPFDAESQMDLDYHDALWPNGYGAEGDPGHNPVESQMIYDSIFRR